MSSKLPLYFRLPHQLTDSFLSLVHAKFLAHIFFFEVITRTIFGEKHNRTIMKRLTMQFRPVPWYFLPNIFLNTVFSNTLGQRQFFNVSDQVSHPCKPTGKVTVLHILIFIFLDSQLKDKRFCTEW
jgi:hypothetical protein